MFPTIPKEEKQFRGKARSEDYNKFTRRVLFDTTQLLNIAAYLEDELEWVRGLQGVHEQMTAIRLAELNAKIAILEESLQSPEKMMALATAKDIMIDVNSSNPAVIDSYNGIVTIPPVGTPTSKLYLVDSFNGDIVLPRSLNVVVTPQADGTWIEDTDIKHSISGSGFKCWQRRVVKQTGDPVLEGIFAQVVIDLPEAIITNRDVNMIEILPYPMGAVDIIEVEYNLEGDWLPVPGFVSTPDANSMMLLFPTMAMRQVRITLCQRRALLEGDKKVYYLGAKRIGIYNASYKQSKGDFLIPFTLGGAGKREIISVEPVFANETALADTSAAKRSVFSYMIYEVDQFNNTTPTRDVLPVSVTSNDIILKASINKDPSNGTVPALKSVKLTYRQAV